MPRYSQCPVCEASFVGDVIPPHRFNRKPCSGGATVVKAQPTPITFTIEITPEHIKLGGYLLEAAARASAYWAYAKPWPAGRIRFVELDSHVEGQAPMVATLAPENMIHACVKVLETANVRDYTMAACAAALFNPKRCAYDELVADVIAQYAVLGEMIYG